ncbi:cupin domain-containing protein [Arthrobacter sp. TMN-49]
MRTQRNRYQQRLPQFTVLTYGCARGPRSEVREFPSRLRVNLVRFAPGAHTAWHRHANGQTLHVTDGTGLVESRGGEIVEMRQGDTGYTPGRLALARRRTRTLHGPPGHVGIAGRGPGRAGNRTGRARPTRLRKHNPDWTDNAALPVAKRHYLSSHRKSWCLSRGLRILLVQIHGFCRGFCHNTSVRLDGGV